MIRIRKHDKEEVYSIYGFYIDPNKDVWVDKKKLIELHNEISRLIDIKKNNMTKEQLNKAEKLQRLIKSDCVMLRKAYNPCASSYELGKALYHIVSSDKIFHSAFYKIIGEAEERFEQEFNNL